MPKTVAEIAAMACRSVGVQEDYAQLRACDYVRERMEYLWTGWALRDTLILFRIRRWRLFSWAVRFCDHRVVMCLVQ